MSPKLEENQETTEYTIPEIIEVPFAMKLRRPYQWVDSDVEGERPEVTELVFNRRLTFDDFTSINDSMQGIAKVLRLVSRCTSKSQAELKRMDAVDMRRAAQVVNNFLNDGEAEDTGL